MTHNETGAQQSVPATPAQDVAAPVSGAQAAQGEAAEQGATTSKPAVKVDQQLLEDVIDAIRPSFQADGGDVELIGVDEAGVVTIEMTGACAACMFATSDITEGIDAIIREHVPGVTAVRPVMY